MTKFNLIKLADLITFIGLVGLISTGIVLRYSLPAGSGGDSIWGLTRHQWGDVHFYICIGFLALMSLHLFLHLAFIKQALAGKASREHKYRLSFGVLGLLALILLLLAPVFSPVSESGTHPVKQFEPRR